MTRAPKPASITAEELATLIAERDAMLAERDALRGELRVTKVERDLLKDAAGRIIRGNKDFGTFLCENSPWMNVCFQLATAAKHFDVGKDTGLEVLTTIEFQVAPETTVHELRGQEEIMVRTPRNSISGSDLVLLLDYIWSRALPRLSLLDPQAAE
jgi:hypothetical protein